MTATGLTGGNFGDELDDYEEGTWTPEMRGSTGSAGSSSTSVVNNIYTKVGQLVFLAARYSWTNQGSWGGTCTLYGLPHTSYGSGTPGWGGFQHYHYVNVGAMMQALAYPNSTYYNLYNYVNDGQVTNTGIAAFDNTGSNIIHFGGMYYSAT